MRRMRVAAVMAILGMFMSQATTGATVAEAAASPACYAVWSAAPAYVAGNTVSEAGVNYRANWWTQNQRPSINNGGAGTGQPWTSQGPCGGVSTTTTTIAGTTTTTIAGSTTTTLPATTTTVSGTNVLTVPGALRADQTKRVYVGYYGTWGEPWYDVTALNANGVYQASRFARIPATYTHVKVAFAQPNFAWSGIAANTWTGTGITFAPSPKSIKLAIDVLHQRNIKVLLAVGGANVGNWGTLAAEGALGSGPTITAFANVVRDLGFDGLDVDYEIDANIDAYANSIKALRAAANLAGSGKLLTLAGWSTGADCISATSTTAACAGRLSYWGGNAGRERLMLNKYPTLGAMVDMADAMTYDAGVSHFDGLSSYNDYRSIFPSSTIVNIGFESTPEGWEAGKLVVNDADAQCAGSVIAMDNYNVTRNAPYSVNRYGNAVLNSTNAKRNPRDGAMLWSITKAATGACGTATVATPGTIGAKVATQFGLVNDPLLASAPWK